MSRSGDFRGDNRQTDRQTDRRTDRQTDYFTPAHACGVMSYYGIAGNFGKVFNLAIW